MISRPVWTGGMITLNFFYEHVAARDCFELDFPIKQLLKHALKDCDADKKLQKHWKGISLNFFPVPRVYRNPLLSQNNNYKQLCGVMAAQHDQGHTT